MTFIAIRVRGSINVRGPIKDTLHMLRLNRTNHCVILPETAEFKGMLKKAKDYITWGEVQLEVLNDLLTNRGKVQGDQPITDKYLKSNSKFKTIQDLTKALIKGEVKLSDVKNVKPVLRLHPPKMGYEGIKRPYSLGGALGYRGEKINDLVKRMI